ncbi:hypothetical protein OG559_04435 [Micromonospora sp. NBC_01405]|uniref:hypothetical protein n=1 Tax=Micromonospora sp. NBC_01405 TaxID=2903589 RepID=UPI003243AC65
MTAARSCPNGTSGRSTTSATCRRTLLVTELPWKVSVDLPAPTTRRDGLLATDGV